MNIFPENILIKDYTYELPQERIAPFPLPDRAASKLLVYDRGQITDDVFSHLPAHIPPGTTLIVNDTRVIEARLLFQKDSGGVIEIFCLEPFQQSIEQAMQQQGQAVWECLIGGASKWKPGQILRKTIDNGNLVLSARYLEKKEDSFLIEFSWQPAYRCFVDVLHAAGAIPLPPYIKRKAEKLDWERYQTVFSRNDGSVAAPTAALHFTPEVFRDLAAGKVGLGQITLHVGAGTFKPVKTENLAGHHMHGEPFVVKKAVLEQLMNASRVVAVGTTSLRTLESLYWMGLKLAEKQANSGEQTLELGQWEAYSLSKIHGDVPFRQSFEQLLAWMEEKDLAELHCRTSLLIAPGYSFRVPDGLITNFHQPQSTLLLLIAAFIGEDWKKVYEHALRQGYRFLSYGDSSLLWRK